MQIPKVNGGNILANAAAHCNIRRRYVQRGIISCAETAEPIELPSEMVSGMRPSNRVLDGRALWHRLANTVERSIVPGGYEWICHHARVWRRGLSPNHFDRS